MMAALVGANQSEDEMVTIEELADRCRTGWTPVADEIDAAIAQRKLTHWTHAVDVLAYGDDENIYSPPTKMLGRDQDGRVRATGEVLWIAHDRAWVVCEDGFWWLS